MLYKVYVEELRAEKAEKIVSLWKRSKAQN